MMRKFFADVSALEGVEAVVLFDNQNRVMDSWMTPRYNAGIFGEVGETFQHIFGLMEHLEAGVEELVVPFDRGQVYARGHARFVLVVIARLQVEVSLIRLATEVCLQRFLEDRKTQRQLKKLPEKKFYEIKSIRLDDVEKIMLETILEDRDGGS